MNNLRLSWRRINTGRNLQYKRFYRDLYLVYEGAADDNLKDLHKRLKSKVWVPSHAPRVYLPKPSGLQRPISLLSIEDQIVLQSIANVFAKKLRKKRQIVELDNVFSNNLSKDDASIFFMERWQKTYRAFQEKCIELYEKDYRWAAHFDISAYYDTISHDLLMYIVAPRKAHPKSWRTIKDWFRVWSAADGTAMTGHGIPQGPIASDFLAESFFLPIDLNMRKIDYAYIRYVDDIRLFGKTENEVRKMAIALEQECRHRGLIPQSKKFEIVRLRSPIDAMGALPSIAPSDGRGETQDSMSIVESIELLKSAIGGKPIKVKDKSRFRFVMYRAASDNEFLKKVLLLMPRHPEHIDAFIAYFSNFQKRKSIVNACLKFLRNGLPYSYVRGELWHVIARMASDGQLRDALDLARGDAKNRKDCLVLSWGVMHFLIRCEQNGVAGLGQRLSAEAAFSRALLAPIFPEKEFSKNGLARRMLKCSLEEQLAIVREMQRREVSLTSLGLRQRELTPICRNSLRSLGVIKRRRNIEVDWIAKKLHVLYGCSDSPIWHRLLGDEYEHALQILIEAEARYPGAYSEWLSLQDSFNDLMIRKFFAFLDSKGLPGHSRLVCRGSCNLVKYGTLIAPGQPFDTHFSNEAFRLRGMHKRRNSLPGSHPYDEKGGAKNRWLTKREQRTQSVAIRQAIDGIIGFVEANS